MAYTHQSWSGIVGMDIGKQDYTGCRLSGEGYVKRRNFKGKMTKGEDGYARLLDEIDDGDLVIMEAGSSSFNLARFLSNNTNAEIVVLNPAQLRLIWDSQRKTDKADAMKLACIGRDMRKEAWPVVSVPSEEEQTERSAVTFHVFLKEDETAKFNRFFALFNSVGYPDIDKKRCKEDMEYRHRLVDDLLAGHAAEIGRILNEGLDLISIQLEEVEQELIGICLRHPRQALAWLSIPGIGLINAASLIAYVGDGSRFSKPEQLMNYAGLVPKLNQSGSTNVHGKVTKDGLPGDTAQHHPRCKRNHHPSMQPFMPALKIRLSQEEGPRPSRQGCSGSCKPYAQDRACPPSSQRHLLHCKGGWL